ncbi:MAG: hypothetical protein L6R39_005721 [Caloplaca ligustica]|nr:MAG: hypothetical protein L6R39_005721 [Caloplaca ligustica]
MDDVLSNYELENHSIPRIKLLNILPAHHEANRTPPQREIVQCELQLEALSEAPEYEALSYTWGSTSQEFPVQVQLTGLWPEPLPASRTKTFHVTKHLHAALLRLQQPKVPRLVWIDQLCIDQSNTAERNSTVSLMAEIYRRAKRTIVWLGETSLLDEDRDYIVDAAERMNFRPVEREWSEVQDQNIIKDMIGVKAEGEAHELGQRRRQALAEFLNRPWFTRAWVFQEVVVAKRGTVLCGSLEMDMDIFINLLDGVCELDMQEVGEARSIMRSSKGYKPMFAIREGRFETRNGLSSSAKSNWLATLWQAMGNVNATDPRDKVYAFLAFSDTQVAPIEPNYAWSVGMVYTDAARQSILNVRSLDVLELALKTAWPPELLQPLPDFGPLFYHLPSWVPDFSRPLPSLPFMTHNTGSSNFRASRKIPYPYTIRSSLDRDGLRVQGHFISTVSSICPIEFPTFDPSQTLHETLVLEEVVTWVRSELAPGPPTPLSDPARVLRTLFAEGAGSDDTPNNMNYDSPRALAAYRNEPAILRALVDGIVPAPYSSSDPPSISDLKTQYSYYRWMKKVSEIVTHKKLFLTKDGDMGLAYEAIREGDVVAILLGSKTPTVLRKMEQIPGKGEWRFVAQCYLDGWMRGEEHEGREWTEEGAERFMLY